MLATGCEPSPKALFESAEDRWKQGDYLGATQSYKHLIDEYPKSDWVGEAHYAIGTIEYLYLNNYPKAVEAFETVVSYDPTGPLAMKAHRNLAEIYIEKYQDRRQAIAEYRKLLEKVPDRTAREEIQFRMGELYFDEGDFEQAQNEWGRLAEQHPEGPWADNARYRIGSTYFAQGQYADALGIYQDTITRYPESDVATELKFWAANCLEELGRFEDALELYQSIEGIYPNPQVIQVKIRSARNQMKTIPEGRPIPQGHPANPG